MGMAKTNQERQAAYRARRRESGLCLESGCQQRKPKGYARCGPCRELVNERRERPASLREMQEQHRSEILNLKVKHAREIGTLYVAMRERDRELNDALDTAAIARQALSDGLGLNNVVNGRCALPLPQDAVEYDAVVQLPKDGQPVTILTAPVA